MQIDGTPGVAFEAGVEKARRVFERGAFGEGHFHDTLVRLAGAYDSGVRPHRNPPPLPLLDHFWVGLPDEISDLSERLASPITQPLDSRIDQPRGRVYCFSCLRAALPLLHSLSLHDYFRRPCAFADFLDVHLAPKADISLARKAARSVGTRCATLLVRVEDVVLRLNGHMALRVRNLRGWDRPQCVRCGFVVEQRVSPSAALRKSLAVLFDDESLREHVWHIYDEGAPGAFLPLPLELSRSWNHPGKPVRCPERRPCMLRSWWDWRRSP